MIVKATKLGYYGNIRIREGQAFRLKSENHFSKEWMVKVGKKTQVDIVEPQKPIESPLVQEPEEEQVTADKDSEVI